MAGICSGLPSHRRIYSPGLHIQVPAGLACKTSPVPQVPSACRVQSSALRLSVCVCTCSVMSDSLQPWTVAHQGLLSMEFSRQEYWSGLPFPPPGELPNPGIEPASLASPALAGAFFTTSATWEACASG